MNTDVEAHIMNEASLLISDFVPKKKANFILNGVVVDLCAP